MQSEPAFEMAFEDSAPLVTIKYNMLDNLISFGNSTEK